MTEESWVKKPYLLHRQLQLDEINDLLERCCDGAGLLATRLPICELCSRRFDSLADKKKKLTPSDTQNMVRIILIRKQLIVAGGTSHEKSQ